MGFALIILRDERADLARVSESPIPRGSALTPLRLLDEACVLLTGMCKVFITRISVHLLSPDHHDAAGVQRIAEEGCTTGEGASAARTATSTLSAASRSGSGGGTFRAAIPS